MYTYPAGWPLWRFAARSGIPIEVKIRVEYDPEERVYVACDSNLPGLVAEAESVEELLRNVDAAIDDLMETYLQKPPSKHPIRTLSFGEACPA